MKAPYKALGLGALIQKSSSQNRSLKLGLTQPMAYKALIGPWALEPLHKSQVVKIVQNRALNAY